MSEKVHGVVLAKKKREASRGGPFSIEALGLHSPGSWELPYSQEKGDHQQGHEPEPLARRQPQTPRAFLISPEPSPPQDLRCASLSCRAEHIVGPHTHLLG